MSLNVDTHVGYTSLFKKFTIDKEKNLVDFWTTLSVLNIDKEDDMMEEVPVKSIPPMNEDTIEFNT
jgi:hypothetical protein